MSDEPLLVADPVLGVRVLTLNRPHRLNAIGVCADQVGQRFRSASSSHDDVACRSAVGDTEGSAHRSAGAEPVHPACAGAAALAGPAG